MRPADAADLDEAALDALLEAELAELGSEASASPTVAPSGDDDDDDEGRSVASNAALAEAWEHLHLGNEIRHQNADQFEKDFEELLCLARYETAIDPVVRVVVGELLHAVEKAFAGDETSIVEAGEQGEECAKAPTRDEARASAPGPDKTSEARSTRKAPEQNTAAAQDLGSGPKATLARADDSLLEVAAPGKTQAEVSQNEVASINESIDDGPKAEEENKFLASLAADLAEREEERRLMLQEIEAERKKQRAALEAQWAREDAAVRIQCVARGWGGRRARQKRRNATFCLQRVLCRFSAKLEGFRIRQRLRLERSLAADRAGMAYEDHLAHCLRALLSEERAKMEREDSLAHSIRVAEKAKEAEARHAMSLEDMHARDLREAEIRAITRERNEMASEDRLAKAIRASFNAELVAMQAEDARASEVRASAGKLIELSTVGTTAYLSGKGLEDMRDASSASVTSIVAERNSFQSIRFAGCESVLSRLTSLQLARNELRDLRGLEACAHSLEYLDVSANHLDGAALEALMHLRVLRVLNISGNAVGHLNGEKVVFGEAPLERLFAARCELMSAPRALTSSHLRVLDLSDNLIDGPALLDDSCMLPELQELNLAGNPLRRLKKRSAHLCPGLQSLDLRNVKTSEQDLVEVLVEHIHLTGLELGSRTLSKSATRYACRFLRRLKSIDGDLWFRQRVFEDEIVDLQAAVRGARTRERIRSALDRTRGPLGAEDSDDIDAEFASVDVDAFIPQLDEADLVLDPEVSPSASPLYSASGAREATVAWRPAEQESEPGAVASAASLNATTLRGKITAQSSMANVERLAEVRGPEVKAWQSANSPGRHKSAQLDVSKQGYPEPHEELSFAPGTCFSPNNNDLAHATTREQVAVHNVPSSARSRLVEDSSVEAPSGHCGAPESHEEDPAPLLVQSARSRISEMSSGRSGEREEPHGTPDPTRGYQKSLIAKRKQRKDAGGRPEKASKTSGKSRQRGAGLNFMSVNRRDRQQHLLKRSRKLIPAWARKTKSEEQ